MRGVLIALGVIVSLFVLALAWLVVVYPNQAPPGGNKSKVVAIELSARSTTEEVTARLASEGLIAQPRLFALYARVLGAESKLRRGRVLLTPQMSARQLLQRVAAGFGSTSLLITIPEGFNRYDIAARLDDWNVCSRASFLGALDHLQADADGREGYLFPDTYWLHDEMPAEQVIARLSANARKRYDQLQDAEQVAFQRLRDDFGFGLHEVVILASIVEKEAHLPSEQPVIAGVFLNRLSSERFHPKRLQADPTVAYGCALLNLPSCSGFDGKHITRAMLLDSDNPYNTYRIEGLPPSPIANPGLSALRAVLHPAVHDYFYFVSRGDGRHVFSSDLAAHNSAVHGEVP